MFLLVCLFHTPHFKLTVSRMKRGGIEEIAVGISQNGGIDVCISPSLYIKLFTLECS